MRPQLLNEWSLQTRGSAAPRWRGRAFSCPEPRPGLPARRVSTSRHRTTQQRSHGVSSGRAASPARAADSASTTRTRSRSERGCPVTWGVARAAVPGRAPDHRYRSARVRRSGQRARAPRRLAERAVPSLRRTSVLSRSLPAAVVLVALLGAAGCGGSSSPSSPAGATAAASAAPDRQQAVPAKFAAACGKPGSRVSAPASITIKHADCDLTGVTISSPGQGGAVVPEPGRGVSNSGGLSLSTNPEGDVTVSLEQ